MKTKSIILIAFLFLYGIGQLKSQIFKLDSVIYSQMRLDSIPKYILLNENSKGRLPIFASEDIIKLFQLKDTLIDDIQINYFTNVNDMLNKYQLKQTGTYMSKLALVIKGSTLNRIEISMTYSAFKCDKYTIRKRNIISYINGRFIIIYDPFNFINPIEIKELEGL